MRIISISLAIVAVLFSLVMSTNKLRVTGAGSSIVNGLYHLRQAEIIPSSFSKVCFKARWNPSDMWDQLNRGRPWWETENGSYIYYNGGDGQWWMDSGETGLGLYISTDKTDSDILPPLKGWEVLGDGKLPLPKLNAET
jgi:hypothetical protein